MSAEPRPTHFGSGWISGVLAVAMGAMGLLAVLCLHFPALLTVPEVRAHLALAYVRALIHLFLVAAFLLGLTSVCLRQTKILGLTAMLLTMVAALLGGSRVPIEGPVESRVYFGLDWFLLSLLVYSAVFMPIERLFPRLADQRILRKNWRTDLVYFFLSSLFVQATTYMTLKPAAVLFSWASGSALQAWVQSLPGAMQFVMIMLFVDLVQYWVHRLFHTIPWLWRFHAVHHSAESMDWLAGSRLHVLDMVITRGATFIPIYALGFDETVVVVYLIWVSFQATLIHANIRFTFGPLRYILTTPQFHHWHHGAEREAIDKNFAVHLPVLDLIFGTFFLPGDRWPARYGLDPNPVPELFTQQLVYPFRSRRDLTDGGSQ